MEKSILKIMLGTIILEAILVCIFILIGNFDDISWRAMGSVGIIFGYSIPCLFYSKVYDNKKYRYIAIGGASVVCVAALLSIFDLWELVVGSNLGNVVATFNNIIWTLAFISWILSYESTNNLLNLFKKISISLIVLLSIFIAFITWEIYPQGILLRLFFVLIILTVGSFICTLILTRIYRKELVQISRIENNIQTTNNQEQNQPEINSIEANQENSKNSEN